MRRNYFRHTPTKDMIAERCQREAIWMLENKATVRQVAKQFGVSKSTVHLDMRDRLWDYNTELAQEIGILIDQNKEDRYLRGGLATKAMYDMVKQINGGKRA